MGDQAKATVPCCFICTPIVFLKEQAKESSNPPSKLETSFVNVPYSPPNAIISNNSRHSNRKEWHGSEMYEVTRSMERMLSAIEDIVGEVHNDVASEKYYCKSCLNRLAQALDEHSSLVIEECGIYNEAASREEDRVNSITRALSNLTTNIDLDSAIDKEDAMNWALDQFHQEIQVLTQACKEQEHEIRMLQNLAQEQIERSKTIDTQEANAFYDLNSLERDAHNFTEESHHLSNMCSSVLTEIDSLSRIKLISIPFHIEVSHSPAGRYPLINNLRLAYRTNEKANLHRAEINAAWVQAAQLVTFTCGLYPNFHSTLIRIIPLSFPCAKIQILAASSGTNEKYNHVYNLGWDKCARDDIMDHIPTSSLIAFLSLLSDFVAHILSETKYDAPPFEMTQSSIDGSDVSQFLDSDPAWSSVVYCLACNLNWLSKLPVKPPCIL